MAEQSRVYCSVGEIPGLQESPPDPCIMVIFGASGDLTKRLLMPALYNLTCDRLLPEHFAIIGLAMDEWTSAAFRQRLSADIRRFSTAQEFDAGVCDELVDKLYYTPGRFDDPEAFRRLAELVKEVAEKHQAQRNLLFYMATPPPCFGTISANLQRVGLNKQENGWTRIVVEKPFGHDLRSAVELNRDLLAIWKEEQIYRIDHYLGKETVQNLLAFRFSNGIFEPLWNRSHIDHIQFAVSESVGVEGRGNYYERSGVLRDMMQNHMFQMLAYLCMEPPSSFQADAIRNEKAKLLEAVRMMTPEEVLSNTVRGQYGPGLMADGSERRGYREEPDVDPASSNETYLAVKLAIDNWRWEGVPIYLRSGKSLWKRGTEIIVQFKKAPEALFADTPVQELDANRLLFHIQPDQGVELRFQAKTPGPLMQLQKVNMRFSYGEAFRASRGTGYEVLIYNCMIGDATLFSRTDLVETAWRIAQPMFDSWADNLPTEFPNYPSGTWGPPEAFELIERDGRRWLEVINREVLERVPLFYGIDSVFLGSLAMMLKPLVFSDGEDIIRKGDLGKEMYFICRGEVQVIGENGQVLITLGEGSFFGEIALLKSQPRTVTIRAKGNCDLFVLEQADFARLLRDQPQVAESIQAVAQKRDQGPELESR